MKKGIKFYLLLLFMAIGVVVPTVTMADSTNQYFEFSVTESPKSEKGNEAAKINIKNISDQAIKDVVLTAKLPESFAKDGVTEVKFKIGELKPGQSSVDIKDLELVRQKAVPKVTLPLTGGTKAVIWIILGVMLVLVAVVLLRKNQHFKLLIVVLLMITGIGAGLFARADTVNEGKTLTANLSGTNFTFELSATGEVVKQLSNDTKQPSQSTGTSESSDTGTSDTTGTSETPNSSEPTDSTSSSSDSWSASEEEPTDNSGGTDSPTEPEPVAQIALTGRAYDSDDKLLVETEIELKRQNRTAVISELETDTDGYLFTHVLSGETYTLYGEKFEVTVTVNGVNEFEVTNVKGKFVLGQEEVTDDGSMTIAPSAIKLDEASFEYSVSADYKTLTVDAASDLQAGDVVYLAPNEDYIGGLGLKITSIEIIDGKIVANVVPAELEEVATHIQGSAEDISLTQAQFVPAEDVELIQPNLRTRGFSAEIGASLSLKQEPLKGSLDLKIKGSVDTEIDINPFALSDATLIIKPELSIDFKSELSLTGKIEAFKKNIGTIYIVTGIPAVTLNFPVDIVVSAEGKISVEVGVEAGVKVEAGFKKGAFIHKVTSEIKPTFEVKGSLTIKSGVEISESLAVLTQIEALKLTCGGGVKVGTSWAIETPLPTFEPTLKLSGEVKKYNEIKVSLPILSAIEGFEFERTLLKLEEDFYKIDLEFPLTDANYVDYQTLKLSSLKANLEKASRLVADNAAEYAGNTDYQKIKAVVEGSDALLRGFSADELINLINQGQAFNDKNGKRYFVDQQHVNLINDAVVGLIDAFKKNNEIDDGDDKTLVINGNGQPGDTITMGDTGNWRILKVDGTKYLIIKEQALTAAETGTGSVDVKFDSTAEDGVDDSYFHDATTSTGYGESNLKAVIDNYYDSFIAPAYSGYVLPVDLDLPNWTRYSEGISLDQDYSGETAYDDWFWNDRQSYYTNSRFATSLFALENDNGVEAGFNAFKQQAFALSLGDIWTLDKSTFYDDNLNWNSNALQSDTGYYTTLLDFYANSIDTSYPYFWLRSAGDSYYDAGVVDLGDFGHFYYGGSVGNSRPVRPALWISVP